VLGHVLVPQDAAHHLVGEEGVAEHVGAVMLSVASSAMIFSTLQQLPSCQASSRRLLPRSLCVLSFADTSASMSATVQALPCQKPWPGVLIRPTLAFSSRLGSKLTRGFSLSFAAPSTSVGAISAGGGPFTARCGFLH
jgi:hypothetical protein